MPGAWSCGMVVGLIHDIPTAKELIDASASEREMRAFKAKVANI
jgi:hypothetical protein